ncbi:MAG: polymer-forming cytoskeletal protein [Desulfosarcina sp.]|nr:polymer-forming cytoskeletal protein [Desulfobacterales bacterium]
MIWKKKTPPVPNGMTAAAVSEPVEQTVIAECYTIKGRIHGQGQVEIRGRMEGNLEIRGRVLIHAAASVQGEIKTEILEIDGHVEGRLEISQQLRLGPTARFEGSAAAVCIDMAEGARLNGDVTMKS